MLTIADDNSSDDSFASDILRRKSTMVNIETSESYQ